MFTYTICTLHSLLALTSMGEGQGAGYWHSLLKWVYCRGFKCPCHQPPLSPCPSPELANPGVVLLPRGTSGIGSIHKEGLSVAIGVLGSLSGITQAIPRIGLAHDQYQSLSLEKFKYLSSAPAKAIRI